MQNLTDYRKEDAGIKSGGNTTYPQSLAMISDKLKWYLTKTTFVKVVKIEINILLLMIICLVYCIGFEPVPFYPN